MCKARFCLSLFSVSIYTGKEENGYTLQVKMSRPINVLGILIGRESLLVCPEWYP